MSRSTARRAIIIGGGIGGMAAAVALRQIGWDAQVYERAAELREVGAGLIMWANAVRALDQLGLAEPVRALRPPSPSGGVYTSQGAPLVTQSVDELERRVGEISVVVHRAELLEILRDALPAHALHLGRECAAISQDTQGVTARFADGHQVRGDLLVGADGIRSVVRAQLVGDGAPHYAGYTAWRGVASYDPARMRAGEYWGCGARFGLAPLSGGRVYWFAVRNAPAGQRASPEQDKALLLQTFRGWCEPIETLIEATPAEAILHNDIADRAPLRRWSDGRVTLLGDAAHPMTPNLGQGACQALEDAVALRDGLRDHTDMGAALQRYEQRRVRRANGIVLQSRRIGQVGQWSNPVACAIRDALTRALLAPLQARALDQVVGYRPG